MDTFQIVVFITVLIGIVLIVVALISMKVQKNNSTDDLSGLNVNNTIEAIHHSVNEAELTIDEIEKTSEQVLTELESKYQELLFLYSLVDQKKGDLLGKVDVQINESKDRKPGSVPSSFSSVFEAAHSTSSARSEADRNRSVTDATGAARPLKKENQLAASGGSSANAATLLNNQRYKDVIAMQKKGMSYSEMAKTLGIGQGEVKLIIDLGKLGRK